MSFARHAATLFGAVLVAPVGASTNAFLSRKDSGDQGFVPAVWSIGDWNTGTDDDATLCYGMLKGEDPDKLAKKCAGAVGTPLPYHGCAGDPDQHQKPPKNGTWDKSAKYPTFLDGYFNQFQYPMAVPTCSSDAGFHDPKKHVENAEVKEKRWNKFHGEVKDNPYSNPVKVQYACIANPSDPTKMLKAMIANGHGPGKCGSVVIWSTAQNPGSDQRVVVSIQTGTRNWSTETSAQQYLAEANTTPKIDGGGGGCFQPFVAHVDWDCTDEDCEMPTTNGVKWTKMPDGGSC